MTYPLAMGLLVAGCGCSPEVATLADGGADAGADAREDAGPWRPSFLPRVIFEDTTVACAPVTGLTFAADRGDPVAPGTVLWVYDPWGDSARVARYAEFFIGYFDVDPVGLTVRPDGGLVALTSRFAVELGVSAAGTFDFAALGDAFSRPAPTWLPPNTTLYQDRDRVVASVHSGGPPAGYGIPRDYRFPIDLPGAPIPVGTTAPALLADGSVVWIPTTESLVVACASDGRVRLVVQQQWRGSWAPVVYGVGDGGFVFVSDTVYRYDGRGRLMSAAFADVRIGPDGVVPFGVSESCGIAMGFSDRLEWWSVDGLESRSSIRWNDLEGHDRAVATPAPDCGVLFRGGEATRPGGTFLRRMAPDGTTVYQVPVVEQTESLGGQTFFLRDGRSVHLLLSSPPRVVVRGIDGGIELDVALTGADAGSAFEPAANALAPDGVLYAALTNGRIVAIEIGTPAAYPTFGFRGMSGIDWAHTNSTWLTQSGAAAP